MNGNILLTGKPGIGKTTAVRKIVEGLDPNKAGGFMSHEIRERGGRVGFAIETLSGKKGILAHIGFASGPRVSKYRVSVKDIDFIIVPELEMARKSGRIIIIDEIAKMELFSKKFEEEVRRCLDTRRVIGTIQERVSPFLDEVRSREDVELLELNLTNRDLIPHRVLELIRML